uniref:Essential MCU regulator, mitochondrial n=1 Tax=Glossina palpalis gambiensis TaxID=67801 RepID=A0A1B0C6A7_9MUSC
MSPKGLLSMRATAAIATATFRKMLIYSNAANNCKNIHSAAHFRSGAVKPKPEETNFALGRIICTVIPGLFVGAAISKTVANFLEENDLFVPEDDDDDDD